MKKSVSTQSLGMVHSSKISDNRLFHQRGIIAASNAHSTLGLNEVASSKGHIACDEAQNLSIKITELPTEKIIKVSN